MQTLKMTGLALSWLWCGRCGSQANVTEIHTPRQRGQCRNRRTLSSCWIKRSQYPSGIISDQSKVKYLQRYIIEQCR